MARPHKTEQQRVMLTVLGENLRVARIDAGMTQEDVARAVGADADYIRDIEKGRVEPSVTRFINLAWAVGTTLSALEQGLDRPNS